MRLGFVDHHLNNFHANKFLQLLHGPLAALGARVECAWESDPVGDDWCGNNGVRREASPEAVAAACDAVLVLAPDNIDAHRELCARVFPGARRVLVDKFLATTTADAAAIVQDASARGVALFSASSLRFAVEHRALFTPEAHPAEAFARGMGDWEGYGIHTLSLVVASLGIGVRRVLNGGNADTTFLTLEYADGRRGWVEVRRAANQWEVFPWCFGFRFGDQYRTGVVRDYDGFYANLMREAVRFFETGDSPIATAEMLEVVAVLEAAAVSLSRGGAWVEL